MSQGKPPWLQNRSSSFQSCKTFSAGWGLSALRSSNGGLNQTRNRNTNKKLPVKHKVLLNKQELMLGPHYDTFSSRSCSILECSKQINVDCFFFFSFFSKFFAEFIARCKPWHLKQIGICAQIKSAAYIKLLMVISIGRLKILMSDSVQQCQFPRHKPA